MKKFLLISVMLFGFFTNAYANDLNQHENVMVNKVWLTTNAIDQSGNEVPATDNRVAAFFGLANYSPDHTFKMLTLDFKPKLSGD